MSNNSHITKFVFSKSNDNKMKEMSEILFHATLYEMKKQINICLLCPHLHTLPSPFTALSGLH